MQEAYDAKEGAVGKDDPRGFYKRFYATPKMIFGDNPDERVRRQTVYFETYLDILSELLQKKLLLNARKAEDLTIDFIYRLFSSPAIKENAYGKYRYYISAVVVRFAVRRLKDEAKAEKRRIPAMQWLAMRYAQLQDFVTNGIFNVELRQIRKAIEEGVIDDYLRRGLVAGELTERDLEIWRMSAHKRMSRSEIAASRKDVNTDTVKNVMVKLEKFFRRHARELRLVLRGL